ncbi:MAG: MarR family transcriptional regulator [Actinomycetales bacterium]|nr:MarR family transcriptional regulator [Actinomycetales bacterium]
MKITGARFPGDASERIARLLLDGPATASDLARRLGHAPAGVRRTLTQLVEHGLVHASDRPPYGPAPAPRRGRPSLVYSLTDAGRAQLCQGSDDLALEAMRFLQRSMGDEAVRAFAQERAQRLLASKPLPAGDASITAPAIAQALTEAGYSATVEGAGEHGPAIQICQHTCPVVGAATEFPALCEEETAAMSRALGRHAMRLATLAAGDGVCTTVIPVETAIAGQPPSSSRIQRGPAHPTGMTPSRKASA